MRKMAAFLIAVCVLVCSVLAVGVASAMTGEADTAAVDMRDIGAAILVETSSQQVLMETDADELLQAPGLAKLPAILVLCEAVDQGLLDLSQDVTVSQRAAGISGPTAFIENGETIQGAHLMKAAVMICAGDAIMALGEAAYGTEGAFFERIAARLKELNIEVSLEDAIGKNAMLSVRMLARIGAELMRSTCFSAHSTLTLETFEHKDGRSTELVSANKMLRNYSGCTGVATGSSPSDGYGGVFYVARGDTKLICVVLGAKNSSTRFSVAQNMLDQAYATLRTQKLSEQGEILAQNVRVKGGTVREVNLVAKETVVLLLDKAEPALTAVPDIPETLIAPIEANEVVGTIVYQNPDGLERGRVEIVVEQPVEQFQFRACVSEVLLVFLRR